MAINLANSRFRRMVAARRASDRLGEVDRREDRDIVGDVALREAVSRLPTRQKTALVLRFYADFTPDEVAEQIGCSAQAVRNLTHRAVARLRDELSEATPGGLHLTSAVTALQRGSLCPGGP